MAHMVRKMFFWTCLGLVVDEALIAQSAGPAAEVSADFVVLDPNFAIRKRVEEVRVLFSVIDRHGRPVTGLRRDDVVVEENGRHVASLTSFSGDAGLPLRLTVLVDSSRSMAGSSPLEGRELERRLTESYSLTSAIDWRSFSADIGSPQLASPESLRSGGSTAMLDALWVALQRRPSEQEQPGRRVILLLSDGEDNVSRHAMNEVMEEAERVNIAIYAVAAHSSHLQFPGDSVLRRLCDATGGRFFLLPNYGGADSVLAQMQSDLQFAYTLSFHPAAGGAGGVHSLAVRIRRGRGLRVYARKAYSIAAAAN